ncbi:hypothetical protein [Laceyella putida]|uniref:SAF domain-containing protein n=1 Tax=Laceyella putida TaxID=110101 RepID=A0ABW2RHN0_9BACL
MGKKWASLAIFVSIAVTSFFIGIHFLNNKPKVIRVDGSLNVAFHLEEMKDKSNAIVVGKYVKLDRTINSARDPQNPSSESTVVYHKGELYQFKVNQVVKGTIDEGDTILVNIPKTKELENLDLNGKLTVTDPNYIKPIIGKSYMLFLKSIEGTDFYGIPFFPYSLEINSDQTVTLAKPQSSLLQQISSIHLEGDSKPEDVVVELHNFAESYADKITGLNVSEVLDTLTGSQTE